jgi:hypothetical protein
MTVMYTSGTTVCPRASCTRTHSGDVRGPDGFDLEDDAREHRPSHRGDSMAQW